MNLNEDQFGDYRMRHRPPNREYGAPLHAPETMFPDVHEHPDWYRTGTPFDRESISVIQAAKGKPDMPVTMFRAVPKHVNDINPGDWVTTSRSYARQHGESNLDGKFRILSRKVPARHLLTEGNSIHEWGYQPE